MADVSQRTQQAVDTAMAGAAEMSRYGRRLLNMLWDPEPTNDRSLNRPVWCLGCSYTNEPTTVDRPDQDASSTVRATLPTTPSTTTLPYPLKAVPTTPPESSSSSFSSSLAYDELLEDAGWPIAFLDDFESRVWMTYRSEFEPISKSNDPRASAALSFAMRLRTLADQGGFSSDTGWGCMIRSGQSLLANTLVICQLGRDWRRGKAARQEREILARFADDPRAPYSLHNFVRHGAVACGKFPGEWFGPSATARCIQALANSNESSLRVYSTGDLPDVYEDSFMAVAKPDGETFHPTLILVGTRLGIDKINQVYWEALTATLQMPQSVGIAGGRPSASHYFIGAQRSGDAYEPGSYLFYLDPHCTRPALPFHEDVDQYTSDDINTCHTRRLRRLHVRDMDPSMLIGFLIKDEDDWDMWKDSVKYVQGKTIINVADHDPARGMPAEREAAIDEVETLKGEFV
uniref:Probable cysteine protease ATG4 n=1 Tax=Cryphonectria parasitica TaxID=5116 RepID=ATG4_CRYPA|nr:RecName: Full=Probable cysteine protease ATG4; AltName: Full=Autophagy-related protein 4 [Cryphonectria parasitica]AAY51673.1 putative cysteine protease Atg4 [Cryphonectria parasitica]